MIAEKRPNMNNYIFNERFCLKNPKNEIGTSENEMILGNECFSCMSYMPCMVKMSC